MGGVQGSYGENLFGLEALAADVVGGGGVKRLDTFRRRGRGGAAGAIVGTSAQKLLWEKTMTFCCKKIRRQSFRSSHRP